MIIGVSATGRTSAAHAATVESLFDVVSIIRGSL